MPASIAAVVRGVKVGPSPAWLRQRLEAVGIRSINNVVDATNYVMLELNQPMHAYDLATLKGRPLVARRARAGEKLVTLDGAERTLDGETTVIADAARVHRHRRGHGRPDTEVADGTSDLFLECAWFEPTRIRRARRALGLSTEASHRFERGVDRWNAAEAMRRCLEIILPTAGGTLEGSPVDLHPVVANPPRIFLRPARVAQVLGLELGLHEVERCLVAIGATVVAKPDDGRIAVDVPGWRPDLTAEIDLIEEVARMHGYDRFPTELRPFRVGALPDAPAVAVKERIRRGMVAEGLSEVVSLPIHRFGRGGQRDAAQPARRYRGVTPAPAPPRAGSACRAATGPITCAMSGCSRSARCSSGGAAGKRPVEQLTLGLVVTGRPGARSLDRRGGARCGHLGPEGPAGGGGCSGASRCDMCTLKVITSMARVKDGRTVGWAGRLAADAPPWGGALFGVEIDVTDEARALVRVEPLPTTPAVERDLSLLVPDGVASAAVAEVIRAGCGGPARDGARHRRVPGRGAWRGPAQRDLPADVPRTRPHPARRRCGRE